MQMALPPTITTKQGLIGAIVGRKATVGELNSSLADWIDALFITDGEGKGTLLTEEQKPVLSNYARNYLAVQNLISGDKSEVDLGASDVKNKLDAALDELSQEIIDTQFHESQEIFNQAIGKLPHANHKELIESSLKLVGMMSEHTPSKESISITEFKEGLEQEADITKFFQETLPKLSKEDFLALQKHLGTIKDLTLCNPGLTVVQKTSSDREINAFLQVANKLSKLGNDEPSDPVKMAEIFKNNNSKIENIILKGKESMKMNSEFSLESFYSSELAKLGLPPSAMKEIIKAIKAHHKEGDEKANNESKGFLDNIAQELMESVPYMALQAVIGFCSNLLHYIPFIGSTAASFAQSTGNIVASRAMAHAMNDKKVAPAPVKATGA